MLLKILLCCFRRFILIYEATTARQGDRLYMSMYTKEGKIVREKGTINCRIMILRFRYRKRNVLVHLKCLPKKYLPNIIYKYTRRILETDHVSIWKQIKKKYEHIVFHRGLYNTTTELVHNNLDNLPENYSRGKGNLLRFFHLPYPTVICKNIKSSMNSPSSKYCDAHSYTNTRHYYDKSEIQ